MAKENRRDQFYQERREDVTAQVVRGPDYVEADEEALRADLERAFNGALKVNVEYFDSLEETAGGKFVYVVCKVPLA